MTQNRIDDLRSYDGNRARLWRFWPISTTAQPPVSG